MLEKLGFFVAGTGRAVKVAVPSWRPDVQGKADIVEEVVRIVGVDQRAVDAVPARRTRRASRCSPPIQTRTRKAKRALAARGMVEAVTWSFMSQARGRVVRRRQRGARARQSDRRRALRHAAEPHSRSGRWRRRSNADRGFADVALFEVGQVFKGDRPEDQLTAASRRAPRARQARAASAGTGRARPKPVDAFDAKADAFAVLAAAGAPMQALQVVPGGPAWFHPGRSGTIQIGPQNVLGHFGELHPRVLAALKAEGPLAGFEVILEAIPEPKAKPTRAKPLLELSPFQPVERDFAFVVDAGVKAADIVRAAQSVDRKLIADVSVFDVYEGKGIEAGKKSIAIAVTMQPRDKTMTDAEIDALGQKIVAEVSKRTGGVLRA